MKGRHSPHPSHCECQDLPTSLFLQEAWSSPLAWRFLNSLFLACGSAYLVASFFQGSSSWWSSVGSDMNGFWEVSSCEGPLVPRAGVFLTFGQLAGNGLPLTRMTVCLLCEFSSLHGNNLAGGGSQNSFHCDVHQGFRKILCPHWWILRVWLPSVEKKKVRFPCSGWGWGSLLPVGKCPREKTLVFWGTAEHACEEPPGIRKERSLTFLHLLSFPLSCILVCHSSDALSIHLCLPGV